MKTLLFLALHAHACKKVGILTANHKFLDKGIFYYMAGRDYFSFETIRDHDKNIICYYVTMIGTIEEDGAVHMRTDLGKEGDEKMAFGRLTVRNYDKKIQMLTNETGSRVYYHYWNEEEGSVDIISFTAKGWRADEAFAFEAGDRVLVQGKAFIRKNDEERFPGRNPELSVTASGLFRIGRARRPHRGMNAQLIPQK